jgi:mycothiol synthase
MTPLSHRVPSSGRPAVPETPGVTWRSATSADIDAITALQAESGRIDHPSYSISREEVAEDFARSYVDVERDTILGIDGSGELVACGLAMPSDARDTLVRSYAFGTVAPTFRGRGIGPQLAAWLDARALEQLAEAEEPLPGWIMVYLESRETAAAEIFARLGYTPARYFFEMRRDLPDRIEDVATPDDITVRRASTDDWHALRLARNDSFRDHWGSQPTTEEDWATFGSRETVHLDLSFVAVDGTGEIGGFVITEVRKGDWEGQGFTSAYIDLVGTTRAFRGRGIAPALLAATLRACAEAGYDKAVLDVDAENPTGALALYEGLGFRQAERTVALTRVF